MKGGPNTPSSSSSSSHEQQEQEDNEYTNNNNNDENENENEEEYDEQESADIEERPKLAEGFFEIESVRKKRSRKGKLQYLIKWRGWPETANTWEPFENLMSCSDIIDAFEERLKSGKKGSSKKQKRKSEVVLQAPPAKKKKKQHNHQQQQQERGSPAATYDVPSVRVKLIEDPSSHPSANGPTTSKWAESSAKRTGTVRKLKRLSDNGSLAVSRQIEERVESDELNVKLSDLKGTSSTDKEKIDELDLRTQDQSGEGVSPSNGISNVNGQNSVWACRSGGAKRRKSGAVKRFKQDSHAVVTNHTPDPVERIASANGVVLEPSIQTFDHVGNCFGSVNTVDTSRSMYAITKIIKPIEYTMSKLNDLRDILVTFLVLRSDGKEVMVDNRYLKANYPLLLINFYEQHIQYASE